MKKGFTLSETLICLGIVGVVAALTVPSVMKNYQKRLLTNQLQKTYYQIANATQTIMDTEHVDNFYETTAGQCSKKEDCEKSLEYWMNNYFLPVKKNCGKNANNLCLAGLAPDSYKTMNDTNAGTIDNQYCIQTSDGAAICSRIQDKCLSLIVDVNGPAAPNMSGRDVFSMDIHQDGSISDYGSGCANNAFGCSAASCGTKDSGGAYETACGCLTSIIEDGWKMNY
mgnify:CR=1 FL=1